jgi:hypothetical protein
MRDFLINPFTFTIKNLIPLGSAGTRPCRSNGKLPYAHGCSLRCNTSAARPLMTHIAQVSGN